MVARLRSQVFSPNMKPFYLDRPLNFAHRGASYHAPENTLAAFVLAAEMGADGIELDVQLSKDGALVVIHDLVLETTTDGTGSVRERTLTELKGLDAGSRFDPAYAGQRIPTLQEVIEAVGHRLLLNIELKTASWRDDGLARAVVESIEDNDLLDRTIVSSFNPLALHRVNKLNRSISTGLLYAPGPPMLLQCLWTRHFLKLDAIHPHHSVVDDRYVEWASEQEYRVHTWTVDEPDRMRALMQRGVDLIISNRPDLLRQTLQEEIEGQMPEGTIPESSQFGGE